MKGRDRDLEENEIKIGKTQWKLVHLIQTL